MQQDEEQANEVVPVVWFSKNGHRPATSEEQGNAWLQANILSCMAAMCGGLLEDPDVFYNVTQHVTTKRYVMASASSSAHANYAHEPHCGSIAQSRAILGIRDCQSFMNQSPVSHKQALVDLLHKQWNFFMEDCCAPDDAKELSNGYFQEALKASLNGRWDERQRLTFMSGCKQWRNFDQSTRDVILHGDAPHLPEPPTRIAKDQRRHSMAHGGDFRPGIQAARVPEKDREPFDVRAGTLQTADEILQEAYRNRTIDWEKRPGTGLLTHAPEPVTLMFYEVGGKTHKSLVAHLYLCESLGADTRVKSWPRQLRIYINSVYRTTRLDAHTGTLPRGESEDDWQTLDVRQLILMFEGWNEQAKGARATSLVEGAYQNLFAALSKQTLFIKWNDAFNPLMHPVMKERIKYIMLWETIVVDKKAILSPEEQTILIGTFLGKIINEGRTDEKFFEQQLESHRKTAPRPGFIEYISWFFDRVSMDLKEVDRHRAKFGAIYPTGQITPQQALVKGNKRQPKDEGDIPNLNGRPDKKPKLLCNFCGWDKRKNAATGKFDPCVRAAEEADDKLKRFNQTTLPWASSPIGQAWFAKGQRFVPKDESKTLANTAAKPQGKHSYSYMLNECKHMMLSQELIPFRLTDVQSHDPLATPASPRNGQQAAKAKAVEGSSGQAPANPGRLLLDTGAIGFSVVSIAFYEKLKISKHAFLVSNATHELHTPLNNKSKTNTEISFHIS